MQDLAKRSSSIALGRVRVSVAQAEMGLALFLAGMLLVRLNAVAVFFIGASLGGLRCGLSFFTLLHCNQRANSNEECRVPSKCSELNVNSVIR